MVGKASRIPVEGFLGAADLAGPSWIFHRLSLLLSLWPALHCFSRSPSLTHFPLEVLTALQGGHQSVGLWLLGMYAHWSRCNKEPLIAAVHSHYYLELCWKLPGCCGFLLVFPQFVSLFFFLCPSSNSQKGPDIAEAYKGLYAPFKKNMHLHLIWSF